MHKQLCACGCGEQVTPKVESQHLNALASALLTSQVLDQNRRSIQWKKRCQAIGCPAPFHQQLVMENTTDINDMAIDHKVHGQSSSGHSRRIASNAGPLGLTHNNYLLMYPSHDHEDISMDHLTLS